MTLKAAILALFCLLAAMFLLGLGLFTLDAHQRTGGIGLIVASTILAVGWLVVQRAKRPSPEMPRPRDPLSTVVWRPYRTASARVSEEFVQRLSKMEAELQRAAQEEGWPIEWKQHEEAVALADEAFKRRKYSKALNAYGQVFDLLMVGVHSQRKQIQHESRWGKGSSPAIKSKQP